VAQLVQENEIAFVDVYLSQLRPTNLRRLPVAGAVISKCYPLEFLPREGKRILLLDEIDMALARDAGNGTAIYP
jgi:hypothetical protein